MIEYEVHGSKWVYLSVFCGAALVAIFALTCWAMWRPRAEAKEQAGQEITGVKSFFSWLIGIAPWAVILIVAGTAAFSVIHTVKAALKPPNW